MARLSEGGESEAVDVWVVSDAAARLTSYACTISARHLKDDVLRLQFNRELAYYAKNVVNDVERGQISPEQGLQDIEREYKTLRNQILEIIKKGSGAVAGGLQFATGASICYLSGGMLCSVAGVPMMLHGANNVYENSRNLIQGRSDAEGPVRKGYQTAAKALGGRARDGNIAYGFGDLGLSVYGMWRMVLKPGAWRLFRYVEADKIRAYKVMGSGPLVLEVGVDMMTGEQVYVEAQK